MNKTASTYRNITCTLLPRSQGKPKKLADSAGACRFVWNAIPILAQQNEAYGKAKSAGDQSPSVSFFSRGKRFTAPRRKFEWLPEYSFKVVRYTLKIPCGQCGLECGRKHTGLRDSGNCTVRGVWVTDLCDP